jgi:hypothetical protein
MRFGAVTVAFLLAGLAGMPARAEEPRPNVLTTDVLFGVTRVLDESSDIGTAAFQVAAIGVRGRYPLGESHFAISASYLHFQQLSRENGVRFAFESFTAGLGYELGAKSIVLRPEFLLGYGIPNPSVSDPLIDPGDTSGGLVYGGGFGITWPRKGTWYLGADLQALHKSRDQGPLWLLSALGDVGIRWEL